MPLVYTDYHSEGERPYSGMIHDAEGDRSLQSGSVLRALCALAGVRDGDEFTITITATGRRPFGDRRVVLAKPHTYEREPEESTDTEGT